ncbi:MAG: hypothetical protein ABEJ80_07155 [Halarchaeum sp.]
MRATLDGRTYRGRALDLRGTGATAEGVARAARDPDGWLRCRRPGPVHEHVGVLDGTGVDVERALAAAARSRGRVASSQAALADVREELDDAAPTVDGLSAARERVAETAADVERLRERVARLGGKVAALREAGADAADVVDEHREATASLADAETERIAAEETLERLERAARDARDERARRLRLSDRERRLARAVRAELAHAVRSSFERARDALPTGPRADALAVVRVARVRAPVALAGGPFERPARAAACLDAPVVLVGDASADV